MESNLLQKSKAVSSFLKNNPDIFFTKADKGNSTVAVLKSEYVNNINNMLKDENTYILGDKDLTHKIDSDLRDILNRWFSKEFIENQTKRSLMSNNSLLHKAYGIPKIYKPNHPYRIIVLTISSPLHYFALFLHKILYKGIHYSMLKTAFSFIIC